MNLAGYGDVLSRDRDTVIKLNLSWTKYFPACSSQPWQVDGIVTKMLSDGFERRRLIPVENKTVVTSPREGCRNNRRKPVLARHGLTFTLLTEVEWQVYAFKSPLLKLNDIFPEGIQIPSIYPGRQILPLPTVRQGRHDRGPRAQQRRQPKPAIPVPRSIFESPRGSGRSPFASAHRRWGRPFWWDIGLLEDRIASGSRDAAQANGASTVPPLVLVSV